MQAAKRNIRVQQFLLLVSLLLFGIKIIAWYLTASVSILTDALESIVNIAAAALGLYSLILSAKPRDENHPYGYGKVEFISSAIEGTLICTAGLLIAYKSFVSYFSGYEVQKVDIGLYLISISAIINYVVGWYALKTGKKNSSYPLIAAGKHLQSDTYSTLAVIAGLILIMLTGAKWLDSAVALLLSGFIMYTGVQIVRHSLAGIMDEADFILMNEMIEYLNANRSANWIDLHNLRIIKYGSILHIDCHLTVPWYFNTREAHREIDALTLLIREKYGSSVEFFIHTDACESYSCTLCTKANCVQRINAFHEKVTWNLNRVAANKKHKV
jgi:cation diffusion facilitator family transporter